MTMIVQHQEDVPQYGAEGGHAQQLTFVLPAVMSIDTAESLAGEFKQLPLAEKTLLTLNAAGVEYITAPGLQLLVSLEKTLAGLGGALDIHGANEAFTGACRDTGLESLLGKAS